MTKSNTKRTYDNTRRERELSYLAVFVAIGTSHSNVFSISALISATVSCKSNLKNRGKAKYQIVANKFP